MISYILSLLALPALCVLWVVFQGWLARQDPDYKGYKAGCGGCTRSCNEPASATCSPAKKAQNIRFTDASSRWSKNIH